MITVSILINGQPIYTRSAVNRSKPNPASKINTYEVDDGTIIYHQIDKGAIHLAKKLLEKIKEVK